MQSPTANVYFLPSLLPSLPSFLPFLLDSQCIYLTSFSPILSFTLIFFVFVDFLLLSSPSCISFFLDGLCPTLFLTRCYLCQVSHQSLPQAHSLEAVSDAATCWWTRGDKRHGCVRPSLSHLTCLERVLLPPGRRHMHCEPQSLHCVAHNRCLVTVY